MVTKAITATTVGINAFKIEAEVDVINSLPNMSIVGLPDSAVSEAKERVHSAIKNSGFSCTPLPNVTERVQKRYCTSFR